MDTHNIRRFNTQPPEGGWDSFLSQSSVLWSFQHTAARRRLGPPEFCFRKPKPFQHTAARRRLGHAKYRVCSFSGVSTHSRPKAAGLPTPPNPNKVVCFNTQPPEGGWDGRFCGRLCVICFNTQPPEGGWYMVAAAPINDTVSTHSRPKAAGLNTFNHYQTPEVSTHSRPKAAGKKMTDFLR